MATIINAHIYDTYYTEKYRLCKSYEKILIIISNDVFIYENFNYNCNSVSISLNTIFADMI